MRLHAIVVGGSFAGLSAATYIARSTRTVRVIDAGRPRNRFADHSHGFFSRDGSEPGAMIAAARAQLAAYGNASIEDGRVTGAEAIDGGFRLTLDGGAVAEAERLVLAYGVSDILPPHRGLAERWGKSVLHCPYCHGYEVRGRRLGVLHAGEHSPQHAMLIAEWGPTTLFLDGHPAPEGVLAERLAARGIVVEPAAVASLEGPSPALSHAVLADGRAVALDALYIGAPTRPNSDLAVQLGCAMDDSPYGPLVRTDADRQTTVPGVFAAGDIARAPHSVAWAVADGVTAGTSLHRFLVFPAAA